MITPTKENIALYLLAPFCVHCGGAVTGVVEGHCEGCLKPVKELGNNDFNICQDWKHALHLGVDWPRRSS